MNKKKYTPIILTIVIVIGSIITMIFLYQRWTAQEMVIHTPAVSKIQVKEEQLSLKSIIHEAEKNVVQIEAMNEISTMTGSGFLYNVKGDIITNAHVIKDADAIYVRTANARIYPAAVVGIGEDTDIAVVRVPQLSNVNLLPLETESYAEIGDEVIALGSPHGFQNTVTLGIISGNERSFSVDGYHYSNAYQISAQITHGNSGGPLINRSTGEIIGINSVGTQDGAIGFSIPIADVYDQIQQWSNEKQNDQLDFASTSDISNLKQPATDVSDAEYVVEYFLDSIEMRDYVNAYTLLGSSLQVNRSYADFRDQYNDIIELDYTNLNSKKINEESVNISIEIVIKRRDSKKEQHNLEFTIGYENDQLKVLSITQ
ncbi:serine protease [Oceanobacillus piezotolerans]|uniref:Serine protease n=1 Tax=Oceanobacillus piezotolerans TaxID=2448030 RepID=A0A498D629_9BACI|nr:trypsin-like peptidase domain-containing protein [Oceanobacillus piezotolerans]RLL45168.1 serine protease [Oceanobacillus piezotolerans]